jgi:hypothetical protein
MRWPFGLTNAGRQIGICDLKVTEPGLEIPETGPGRRGIWLLRFAFPLAGRDTATAAGPGNLLATDFGRSSATIRLISGF